MNNNFTISVEEITPAKAKEYLSHNTINNRHLMAKRVHDLSRIMKNGEFVTTNQGIAFDDKGNLIDGQHRLAAIVESGVSVTMAVAHGIPSESIWAIDTGAKRSTSQLMEMMGDCKPHMRQTHTIAAIRMLCSKTGTTHLMNPKDILDWEKAHPNITKMISGMRSLHHKIGPGCVMAAYVTAYCNGISREDLFAFANVIGKNSTENKFKYNCKAALDFKDWYINLGRRQLGGAVVNETIYTETCKAIYLFANNVKNTKKKSVFELSADMFEVAELKLANEEAQS